MKRLLWILLLVVFATAIKPSLAIDTGLNLVTSPLPITLVSTPGATVSAQLKVKNGGETSETLQMGLMKFSAYGDEGKPRLMDRETGDNYFDWVTFSDPNFVLEPNEWKTVTVTFNVPPEAAFGYYYAVTFARKDEDIPGGPRSTKIVGASACLILLDVQVPNAVRDIEVLEFSTPNRIYEFLPTSFFIKLKNKGNVHIAPGGNIFIDRFSQKDVAILNVNELKGNVLPSSNRIFETEWKDGFPYYEQQVVNNQIVTDSTGKPELKLKWDFSQVLKLRWGKYTANLLLVYDDGEKDIPIKGKLEFWVIPWRIIGGTILAIIVNAIVGILIFKLVNWFKRKNRN